VEVDVNDPHNVVKRIIVVTAPAGSDTADQELEFIIQK
jgi:hypothetical protein